MSPAFRSLALLRSCCVSVPLLILGFIQTTLVVPRAAADVDALGPGEGTVVRGGEGECGTVHFNSDGTHENGYGIRGGMLEPPYGTWAECYSGEGAVCSVLIDLTNTGESVPSDKLIDVYVWDDDGENPGAVLCLETGFDPGTIAVWPSLSRHEFLLSDPCCVSGDWWVGFYSDWGTDPQQMWWNIGADLDGPGGCPRLNIAPGQGFPSGWQDVSVIWVPTAALGIGAEATDCEPTPVHGTSWGRIKSLY